MRETSLDYEARETPFTKALWNWAARAVAAGYSAFSRALRRRQPQAPSDPLALGLIASAGFAAWALGLDFALKSGAPVAPDTRH